ncbi:hypothetical protein K1T35_26595 [Pseudonocardia sp. DSM 110487]|uniref:hypothetical protein n=1 Tax=Pseudonocardia sp. DSM 110487 TaxID=2865833 RepID=UPI001C6960E9|nr:hypothetical protein [Pseudonocardia sp. DSM 110487]QYN32175.1 hypothetical protein K1T35_26595 [Pseudonocardia sp. DSM 110487]
MTHAELAKRLGRMWGVLALIGFVMSAIVTLAWWDAQVNHLSGGPRGSFDDGQMFPWYLVGPGVLFGTYALVQLVGVRRRARFARGSS